MNNKTYKEFISESQTDQILDEALVYGIAVERKLKVKMNQIHSTNDTNKKLDLLAEALHFSLGSIALNLTKNKRHR